MCMGSTIYTMYMDTNMAQTKFLTEYIFWLIIIKSLCWYLFWKPCGSNVYMFWGKSFWCYVFSRYGSIFFPHQWLLFSIYNTYSIHNYYICIVVNGLWSQYPWSGWHSRNLLFMSFGYVYVQCNIYTHIYIGKHNDSHIINFLFYFIFFLVCLQRFEH